MTQHPDLPFEQAKNAEYLARLEAQPPTAGVSTARSRRWVDPAHAKGPVRASFHPLIGRIGFDAADEFLGRACYIGPSRMSLGDLEVVSWDAPVARRLFFGTGNDVFVVDGELAVRRTFDTRISDIADLDDEWIIEVSPSPFSAADLRVPTPVSPGTRRRARTSEPHRTDSDDVSVATDGLSGETALEAHVSEETTAVQSPRLPSPSRPADPRVAGMRAVETVLKKLAAPRSDALRSVLATIQPDQFDVVSESPDTDLLVQGHPGTGKTVVAAYRAAYLVSPERGVARAKSVLLIGPTPEYVVHVRGMLEPLDPERRVVVTHIAAVLEATVDLKSQWSGGIGGDHNDIDARARQFALRAESLVVQQSLVSSGPTARRDHVEAVYTLIRSNGLSDRPISTAADDIAWMSGLPEFAKAIRLRRYLALMAQISLAFQPVPHTDQCQHIVVDEAQDISPIEWNVLEQYLRPSGHWTLVGDMNQRRSDTTYRSWADISDHLGLGDGDEALRPTALLRGYRSTTPILRFADRLLPKAERGATSIQQEGPEPTVQHVPALGSLIPEAVVAAQRLIRTHPHGTVAIITVDPGPLIQWLGKQGWRRGETMNIWISDDKVIRVFVPESARGLEFDAVVVLEPGAFPENLGREGQLYTSVTRANRELTVLWHRGLQDCWRRSTRG